MSRRWRPLLGLLCIVLIASPQAADIPQETRLKAAIIVKLLNFVQWPHSREQDLQRLCLLGRTPLEAPLRQLLARNHRIEVVTVTEATVAGQCQLVYLPPEAEERLFGVLERIHRQPVLSVSDMNAFAERGGMINIVRRGTRFGFRINIASARASKLIISAPLLELADVIAVPAP